MHCLFLRRPGETDGVVFPPLPPLLSLPPLPPFPVFAPLPPPLYPPLPPCFSLPPLPPFPPLQSPPSPPPLLSQYCKRCTSFKPLECFSKSQLRKVTSKCWACCNPRLLRRRQARLHVQLELDLRPDYPLTGAGDRVPRSMVNTYIAHNM